MGTKYYFALGNSQGKINTQYYRARVKTLAEFEENLKGRYPHLVIFVKVEYPTAPSLYYKIEPYTPQKESTQ